MDSLDKPKIKRSTDWLKENFSHIWLHKELTEEEKAGFLAACCDTRRCYLATAFDLRGRINLILAALMEER